MWQFLSNIMSPPHGYQRSNIHQLSQVVQKAASADTRFLLFTAFMYSSSNSIFRHHVPQSLPPIFTNIQNNLQVLQTKYYFETTWICIVIFLFQGQHFKQRIIELKQLIKQLTKDNIFLSVHIQLHIKNMDEIWRCCSDQGTLHSLFITHDSLPFNKLTPQSFSRHQFSNDVMTAVMTFLAFPLYSSLSEPYCVVFLALCAAELLRCYLLCVYNMLARSSCFK